MDEYLQNLYVTGTISDAAFSFIVHEWIIARSNKSYPLIYAYNALILFLDDMN